MHYYSKYIKQLAFIIVIVLLAGSGFYNWHVYQINKSLEIQIRDSVKNTATVMLSELRNIENKASDLDILSKEDREDMIKSVDNIYILAMTLPTPVDVAAEYPLSFVKQVLFEYGVPILERNLKLTNEEMQDFIDLQFNHAYEIIDIVCTDRYKFNQNNYNDSLKKQAVAIQDKYVKVFKSKAYYNKYSGSAANS
ncbi:MAG: hypothetical protein JJE17_02305 [Peptostreptococcaceae bacterium]|nr:hypothetical protein [Peptostreptococcaceae bacterium]